MATFEFETLRRALETRDAELLFGLYQPQARLRVVNQNTPPSQPFEASGSADVESYLGEVCARDMTHDVGDEVIGSDRVSYTETCVYPDGTRVLTANILDLEDGKIANQTTIETWDG